ncbi:Os05g0325000, partial [Oryza sativa Japonica Group]
RSPPHLRGSGSGGCRRTSTRRGRRCATRSRSTSTPLRRPKRSPRARRRGDDIRLGGGVRVERGQHHASAAGLDAAGRRRRRQGPRGVGVDLHDGDDAASATVLRLGRGVRVGEPERWWRRQAGCSCLRQGRCIAMWSKSGFSSSAFCEAALVDMYAKCGDVPNARKVLDGITCPDTICSSSMVACYHRAWRGASRPAGAAGDARGAQRLQGAQPQ